MSKVFFKNLAQAAIFEGELKGQLSDGYWENTRPFDHWQAPCRLEVAVDSENPHNEMTFGKRNYNFANKELVECVGYRMVDYAKVAKLFPKKSVKAVVFIADDFLAIEKAYRNGTENLPDYYKYVKDYISKHRILLKDVAGLKERLDKVEYSEKDLKKDLNQMKRIFKNTYK